MAGRFTAQRFAPPDLAEPDEPLALAGTPVIEAPSEPAQQAPQTASPLMSNKLLDAKVRLHRRLIEEINLSALEKLPDEEIYKHVQQLVSKYVLVERLAL